ncbi:hypothetical protein [Mycobacterium branderi]|uniref:Luciferase-like domain-containing protein n=1 Tax=Mycobacterium branderi TaxID=43348 RepID=A0AA91LT54_9MYCO|nr:hypothetical protein [Mycobacterium branderi]MCV7236030.1 hypothetical protein [Mycobacterium branderi]ORA32787.1 hypothetical protein BST20_24265 [Mycobacterium branderi]
MEYSTCQPLGPVGVRLPVSFTSAPSTDLQREAVVRMEHAGYQAIWTNEVIGKDALLQRAWSLPVISACGQPDKCRSVATASPPWRPLR